MKVTSIILGFNYFEWRLGEKQMKMKKLILNLLKFSLSFQYVGCTEVF